MTSGPRGGVLDYLRQVLVPPQAEGQTDQALLARFIERREEAAFAALVQRHGSLVLGVCQRILGDAHDAEDAFQATFLVLARRAASVRKQQALGSWLYGVAYRTALKSRAGAARRRARERQAAPMNQTDPAAAAAWQELRPLLDAELNRLPEKYRSPLVLCYLQGKTNEEAGRLLGWTKGTVSGRLARARDLLRGRLVKRGLTLAPALLAAPFFAGTASAAVPASLAISTVKAAAVGLVAPSSAALAEGVLRTMFLTRFKAITLALATIAVVGAGGGLVTYHALAGRSQERSESAYPGNSPQQANKQQSTADAPQRTAAQEEKPANQEAERIREAAARAISANYLKQLALAMHNYLDTYQHFPAPAIYSEDGKALLSWRVALLPYIEQGQLYKEFKLDEAWDSPHNKKLLAKMPKLFAPVRGKAKPGHTFYQVFTGKGTVFPGPKGIRLADIRDGTSNTVMIVEGGDAVLWTKPVDLPYKAGQPLPKLGGMFNGGFNMALCDGSVRFVRPDFNPDVMRLLITRADGQQVDVQDLNKKKRRPE